MNNKFSTRNNYRSRRKHPPFQFQFTLTNSHSHTQTPLTYSPSNNSPRMIDLSSTQPNTQHHPNITEFQSTNTTPQSHTCNRKDCMDRKFKAIQSLNKSSPQIKAVSPHKMDIVFDDKNQSLSITNKNPCIHSVKVVYPKQKDEKDLLKQFRELEQARKELKSRKFQYIRRQSFSVNTVKTSQSVNLSRQYNPENSRMYLQVKTKIAKRYNSMFRKYADNAKEEVINENQFLKAVCSARSIYPKRSNQRS